MIKNSLHRMCSLLFFALVLTLFCSPNAYAAAGDVFDKLSNLGGTFGVGLARSGYLIAGIALIGFSVAAIFNKISWKTLAYIMMSTFIITLLLKGAIHDYLRVSGDTGVVTNGVGGNATPPGDAQSNSVPKSGNKP